MDDLGIFVVSLILGGVAGGVFAVSKNPVWAMFVIAGGGILLFGAVLRTPITPSGTDTAVLGPAGIIGLIVGGIAGYIGVDRYRASNP